MLHENVIQQYFYVEPRGKWQTLTPREMLPPAFRTRRVGKCVGDHLLFTIGATSHGKTTGLDREIELIIAGEGQELHTRPSTSGSLKEAKSYLGVNLATISPEILERILEAVLVAVRRRA